MRTDTWYKAEFSFTYNTTLDKAQNDRMIGRIRQMITLMLETTGDDDVTTYDAVTSVVKEVKE